MIQQVKCPNCGGPLSNIQAQVIVCPFCEAEFQRTALQYCIPKPLPPIPASPDIGLVAVGDTAYRVHGRLAQGHHSDVFLARRDAPLTEMVVLKVARADDDPLTREWRIVAELGERAQDTFLSAMLPRPVNFGVAQCEGKPERSAAVYRWRSGFQFTFDDVRAEYPRGVDPRAAVWMWNRLLEQLACLHQLGYVHGAVAPSHLLLHPRDHGLILCGWSKCRRGGGDDLAASADCIQSIVGSAAPRGLTDLMKRAHRLGDALTLKSELKRVAFEAFGPPKFHPFLLSGRR